MRSIDMMSYPIPRDWDIYETIAFGILGILMFMSLILIIIMMIESERDRKNDKSDSGGWKIQGVDPGINSQSNQDDTNRCRDRGWGEDISS